jgi:ankyrin repeat protein
LASENGKVEVARFLADYRADVNVQHNTRSATLGTAQYCSDEGGKDGERISSFAASEEGKLEMVKLLLEQGADINSRNTV